MTDKDKIIKELKKALNSLDITNKYRLNIIRAIEYLMDKSVSEELEDAAKNYALNNTPWDDCKDEIQESFKAGAKWKEQQFETEKLKHCELKRESVSEDLEEACEQLAENARKHKAETSSPFFSPTDYKQGVIDGAAWQKQKDSIVSEGLEEAMQHNAPNNIGIDDLLYWRNGFIAGAKWQKTNLWKPADGDDLPEIDREVIVLCKNGRVAFGHRPVKKFIARPIGYGRTEEYEVRTYDKGGWNIPDVKYWLDVEIPKEIEL